MNRTSRVPYHQNVYDLLGIEPGVCPNAAQMIAEHEAVHGPLPASVREWYLVPKVVPLRLTQSSWYTDWRGTIWYEYSNQDRPESLERVLAAIATPRRANKKRLAQFLAENQGVFVWYLLLNGTDDPPVWSDNAQPNNPRAWGETTSSFSGCIARWFSGFYQATWTPIGDRDWEGPEDGMLPEGPPWEKVYANGLWLRTPAEPFAAPVVDFLAEYFGEPERTPRPGDVTTYTWRPDGGTLRITADHPAHPDPLSAWWVHARTPEQLAAFARLLASWGTLRQTLRADTAAARAVWANVTGLPDTRGGA